MESDTENQITLESAASLQRIPSMPGTPQPLKPLSSDRQNQKALLPSPSLPSILDENSSPRRGGQPRASDIADVKARVAYLNAVSQNNSPTRSTSPVKSSISNPNHAAIQRAILGREEAEAALNALTLQFESAKARERMVSERVESLMEQLTDARNRQRHERAVYEKEIKQTKKSEYKAELAVIKLQEDLKEVRSELEGYKVRCEHEKAEKDKARQEAFERAYVVAGMTEEAQDLKQRLEVAEHERDAAVATAASKMPVEQEKASRKDIKREQESGEKRKAPMPFFNIDLDEMIDLNSPDCPLEVKYSALQLENKFLREQVADDRETIHFMNMQCQFKACPCRMAERDGVRFVHDYEYDAKVRARNAKKRKVEGAEPELPLPVFKSFLQKQAEAKGKGSILPQHERGPAEITTENQVHKTAVPRLASVVEEPAAPLPPSLTRSETKDKIEQHDILEEAASVPLPSLEPMEIDPADDTPEPTAQLEELTQVIVEPGDASTPFLFSTSTNRKPELESVQQAQQSHNKVRMFDELFDISPPKRHMPPRPSTAMGILSVDSPIRLVPDSPRAHQRSMTPDVNVPAALIKSQTTSVALNDTSPVRRARGPHGQSRPKISDRHRDHPSAPLSASRRDEGYSITDGNAPVTPAAPQHDMPRHGRTRPHLQAVQTHHTHAAKEVSTTTTVPLRGETEDTDSTSPGLQSAPVSSGTPFSVPGTPNMTREAAIAQIRARRDRARSINMRKSADDGGKTPSSAARRGVNLNLKDRLVDGRGRDFSQASAPGRF